MMSATDTHVVHCPDCDPGQQLARVPEPKRGAEQRAGTHNTMQHDGAPRAHAIPVAR